MTHSFKKLTLAAGVLGVLGTALFSTALARQAEPRPAASSIIHQESDATDKKSQSSVSKEPLPDTITLNGQKYQQVSRRFQFSEG